MTRLSTTLSRGGHAAAAVLASASAALACPDWAAAPTYGDVALSAGFLPDPYEQRIVAGGPHAIADCIGNGWGGFVAEQPDFDLYWSGASNEFTITVSSGVDSVILVNDPNGNWLYDDDGGRNLEGSITVRKPVEGLYDIWVGTYGSNANATLIITER